MAKRRRRRKPQQRPRRICTRCREPTRNWYPTSGSGKVKRIRCAECLEWAVRQRTVLDSDDLAIQEERRVTIKPAEEELLERIHGIV